MARPLKEKDGLLVGGSTNPFEYARQNGNLPQVSGRKWKKSLKPSLCSIFEKNCLSFHTVSVAQKVNISRLKSKVSGMIGTTGHAPMPSAAPGNTPRITQTGEYRTAMASLPRNSLHQRQLYWLLRLHFYNMGRDINQSSRFKIRKPHSIFLSPGQPRKKTWPYFPLYCLFDRDPYNGSLWFIIIPIYLGSINPYIKQPTKVFSLLRCLPYKVSAQVEELRSQSSRPIAMIILGCQKNPILWNPAWFRDFWWQN